MKKFLVICLSACLAIAACLAAQGYFSAPNPGNLTDVMAAGPDGSFYAVAAREKGLRIYRLGQSGALLDWQDLPEENGVTAMAADASGGYLLCPQITPAGAPESWTIWKIKGEGKPALLGKLGRGDLTAAGDIEVSGSLVLVSGISGDGASAVVYRLAEEAQPVLEKLYPFPERTGTEKLFYAEGVLYARLSGGELGFFADNGLQPLRKTEGEKGFFLRSSAGIGYYYSAGDKGIYTMTTGAGGRIETPAGLDYRAGAVFQGTDYAALGTDDGGVPLLCLETDGTLSRLERLNISPVQYLKLGSEHLGWTLLTVGLCFFIIFGLWWAFFRSGHISSKLFAACMVPLALVCGGGFLLAWRAGLTYHLLPVQWGMLAIVLALLVLLFFLAVNQITRPLRSLADFVDRLAEGDYKQSQEVRSGDEAGRAWRSLNRMAAALDSAQYQTRQALESYYRFVPQGMQAFFDKGSILELQTGEMRTLHGLLSSVCVTNRNDVRRRAGDKAYVDWMMHGFDLIRTASLAQGGLLASTECALSAVQILHTGKPETVLALGGELFARERSEGVCGGFETKFCYLVHSANCLYGLGGSGGQAFPFLVSQEMEFLSAYQESFSACDVRMVVTEQALEAMDCRDKTRYIGFLTAPDGHNSFKLYEVLSVLEDGERLLKTQTAGELAQAIQLYYKNDFYLSRNQFSAILKRNPRDGVARWYIFACEHAFQMKNAEQVRYDLFADRAGGEYGLGI